MRVISQAALAAFAAEPRMDATKIAAIGYCYGTVMALELARDRADLRAVVGFHPGWADHDPQDSANITGKVLLCIGSEDPWMPAKLRLTLEEELRAAGWTGSHRVTRWRSGPSHQGIRLQLAGPQVLTASPGQPEPCLVVPGVHRLLPSQEVLGGWRE